MAAGARILLVARDNEERPLAGLRFAYEGTESQATTKSGATELELPPDHKPGQKIKVLLLPDPKRREEWFLLNPQINIPTSSVSAELVLMRRSAFRRLAADTLNAQQRIAAGPRELTPEERRRVLIETAARYRLREDQLELALYSFAETQDARDRGIVKYLAGQYADAENLLSIAAESEASDLAETLWYLGATQFEQAKYRAAADSFRKALALHGDDPILLSWLGITLHELAEWEEAEQVLRLALELDVETSGPQHPKVASDLNNLAQLLQATNRRSEAEDLLRRALEIDEKSLGPHHPEVSLCLKLGSSLPGRDLKEVEALTRRTLELAERRLEEQQDELSTNLNNFALLLQATNRLSEAESLMRRALEIDEVKYGKQHPIVATRLNNLASLLQMTNRFDEAEPLMRRALESDEKSYGRNHPKVAIRLNNLALLLQSTARLSEAEPLMRRALKIDENRFGPQHPKVAIRLNNLALLLQATNRSGEAEPLMARALKIDENSFGANHPEVAADLNNLASLFQATNRMSEAEPLMRRVLSIFLDCSKRIGYEHPYLREACGSYFMLLHQMGRTDEEIKATLEGLYQSPK